MDVVKLVEIRVGTSVDVVKVVDVWAFVELTVVVGKVAVVELVEIRVGTSVDVG